MSFVCFRLISRSQNWLKQYLVFTNLKNKGSLSHFSSVAYIWGAGDGGQLGTGTKECSLLPIKFPVPAFNYFMAHEDVELQDVHVETSTRLGQFKDAYTMYVMPQQVSHVGCGYGFTIAVKADSHSLWTTGLNSFSQLGRQLSSSSGQGPSTVDLSLSSRVQQISCGRSHSAVLMDNGEVLTCGGHFNGQCGVGDVDGNSIKQFTKIQSLPGKVKQIACGLDHTLFLCHDGRVVSCGWGADGQTGQGHFKDEATFKLIEGELKDVQIKQVASSADCCLALSAEGEVFSWGNNEYGQLAVESNEEQFAVPKRASLLKGLPEIIQVAAGGSFCVALTVTGELYSWGYGVLGHGREVSFSKLPRKVQEFSSAEGTVTRVFCGPDNTAVVTDTGVLYTWGRGSFGRLGLGSEQDQWVPKKVELPGEVLDVSCGVDHMAAILKCS